jgi:hypothetical protein
MRRSVNAHFMRPSDSTSLAPRSIQVRKKCISMYPLLFVTEVTKLNCERLRTLANACERLRTLAYDTLALKSRRICYRRRLPAHIHNHALLAL